MQRILYGESQMIEIITLRKVAVALLFLSVAIVSDSLAHAQQSNHASIKIIVTGFKSSDGKVRISVFSTKQNWLKQHEYTTTVLISNKQCEWIIENVPYGEYAVSVFHDENSNGVMDTGFMRIPKEPIGFSNNSKPSFGPPKWNAAKLTIKSPRVEIPVKMQ